MTGPQDTSGREAELRRRLSDLADTATVDPAAWDTIQRRIASPGSPGPAGSPEPTGSPESPAPHRRPRARPGRPARPRPRSWLRSRPRQLVAVAAAVIAVAGTLALVDRGGGARVGSRYETPAGDDRSGDPSDAPDPGGDTDLGPSGAGPGSRVGDGPGTSSTTTAPPPAKLPDGHPAAVTLDRPGGDRPGYPVQATFWADDTADPAPLGMSLWRSDLGYFMAAHEWQAPATTAGRSCLAAFDAGRFDYDGAVGRAFSFGLVSPDAAEVRIVMAGGDWAPAVIGRDRISGLRAWLGEHPAGPVDHVEARDLAGNVLRTVGPTEAGAAVGCG